MSDYTAKSGKTTGLIANILGAAFIFCKLAGITKIATWSWFWVLSPFWIGIPVLIIVLAIIGIVAIGALIKEYYQTNQQPKTTIYKFKR